MKTQFSSLPNELILIIWTYLGHADAIQIFSSISNHRFQSLLQLYCYRTINFSQTSLSTFQLFCSHLFQLVRHSLEILKIGRHSSSSQLHLIAKSFNYVPLTQIFPKLHTLIIDNSYLAEDVDLVPFLSLIRQLRSVSFQNCELRSKSNLISQYLLSDNEKNQLIDSQFHTDITGDGYLFHYPTPWSCNIQTSLQHLRIDMFDLQSLINLLRFLPRLITLEFRIASRIGSYDEGTIVTIPDDCPCVHLRTLILKLRRTYVEDISVLLNFIRLFSCSVIDLRLAFIHDKPIESPILPPIHGHFIYNDIILHMPHLQDFHFDIQSSCFSDEHMKYIVQSFRTPYWMNKLIGCYYTKKTDFFVMFSMPYMFHEYFLITSDMMNLEFNWLNQPLDVLSSNLFNRIQKIVLYPLPHSTVYAPLLRLLGNNVFQNKMLKIHVRFSHQMQQMKNHSVFFDQLDVVHYGEAAIPEQLVASTYSWLTWIENLRVLLLDSNMFHEIISVIKANQSTRLLHSLQCLIIRQKTSSVRHDALVDILELTDLPSLRHIIVKKYEDNEGWMNICELCRSFRQLETLTIAFGDSCSKIDMTVMDRLEDIVKKEYSRYFIHHTVSFIHLWFEK